jgi:hypothetical protein
MTKKNVKAGARKGGAGGARKGRMHLIKETLKDLPADRHIVLGGMMAVNPRTDCICCKACATAAC